MDPPPISSHSQNWHIIICSPPPHFPTSPRSSTLTADPVHSTFQRPLILATLVQTNILCLDSFRTVPLFFASLPTLMESHLLLQLVWFLPQELRNHPWLPPAHRLCLCKTRLLTTCLASSVTALTSVLLLTNTYWTSDVFDMLYIRFPTWNAITPRQSSPLDHS